MCMFWGFEGATPPASLKLSPMNTETLRSYERDASLLYALFDYYLNTWRAGGTRYGPKARRRNLVTFSRAVGISMTSIKRMINRRWQPSVYTLLRCQEVTGVTLWDAAQVVINERYSNV